MLDGLKVVIDLQFYDLMTDKERSSLGKQLAYCHSVNRKSAKCFNFILTSVTCSYFHLCRTKIEVFE
jgi:Trm5-related predicted tRNA methylase